MKITEEIQHRNELQICRVPPEMPHELDDFGKHDPDKKDHKRGGHARNVRRWLRNSDGAAKCIAKKRVQDHRRRVEA